MTTEQDKDKEMVSHLKRVLRDAHMAYSVALKHKYGPMVIDPIREGIHNIHSSIDALEGNT